MVAKAPGCDVPQGPDVAAIFGHPGLLKLELMRFGVRLTDIAARQAQPHQARKGSFGNAADLDLMLDPATWVSAPQGSARAARSPYELHFDDGFLLRSVTDPTQQRRVELVPPSPFYERTTSSGVPLSRFGTIHGSYLALSPFTRCEFVGTTEQCRFCSLDAQVTSQPMLPVEDIVEAVRIAREAQRIDMVYLSIGHLGGDDAGVRQLEPYVRAVKKAFDLLVAVDSLPPRADAWIDRAYAMGVDSIAYNLEIFDPEAFERICPGPARSVGRARYLDALSYAATVFPSGAVTCHLIVGLEPLERTREGIDELVSRRVVPVLPMFRPFKGIDMGDEQCCAALTTVELSELYGYLYQQLRAARINMSWVRNISVVTTPAEGRYFSDEPGGLTGLLRKLTGGRDRSPSTTLADWRRALRVKEVDESLKSSGL